MSTTNDTSESVKVMVRIRPMNEREKDQNCRNVLEVNPGDRTVGFVADEAAGFTGKLFQFDEVFEGNQAQKDIYERSAFNIIETLIEGYNGTVFAYGQTGCGKTHTMVGELHDEQSKGIIPRACKHILTRIGADKEAIESFELSCSFIEIYNEQIYDLLDPKKAKRELKESPQGGVVVKDATHVGARDLETILGQLARGNQNRAVGETAMNKGSSRSHCIFTLYLQTSAVRDGRELVKKSKLNLVDLAGSERQSKTHAKGDRLKEANSINLSLSALGNVIAALTSKKNAHVPYRDSKLTRLLQDSLGGNTKTLMMAAVSPVDQSYEETLSTLKYAARASKIKNAPRINEDPKDTLIKKYREEIMELKALITANQQTSNGNREALRSSTMLDDQEASDRLLNEEVHKRETLEQQLKAMEDQMSRDTAKKLKNDIKVSEADVKYLNQVRSQNISTNPVGRPKNTAKAPEKAVKSQQAVNQEKIAQLERQLKELDEEKEYLNHRTCEETRELTESIHCNEKELSFLKKVANIIFSEAEVAKVFSNTIFSDDDTEFMIPEFSFVYEEAQNLPSLGFAVTPKDHPADGPLKERVVNTSYIKGMKKSTNYKQNEILQVAKNVAKPFNRSVVKPGRLQSLNP